MVVPRSAQLSDTCVDALNVRPFDTLEDRARGGIRPGLAKFLNTQIGNTQQRIQELVVAPSMRDADPSANAVYVRTVYGVTVAGGTIYRFDSSNTVTAANTSGARTLSSTVPFVLGAQLFNKIYFTDGISYKVWHGINNNTTDWTLSDGTLPGTDGTKTARLIEMWRGRLVMAGLRDDAHNFWMTKLGDPLDLNTSPVPTTEIDAVTGGTGVVGKCGDIINCIIPFSNDLLLFGCDSSMWMMSGDPAGSAGKFDEITSTIGTAFGRPWCRDDAGSLYVFTNRGSVVQIGAGGSSFQDLTRDTIGPLVEGTNLNSTFVRMGYSPEEDGFHIFLTPMGSSQVKDNAVTFDGSTAYMRAWSAGYASSSEGALSGWLKTNTSSNSIIFAYMENRLVPNFFNVRVLANGKLDAELFESGGSAWEFCGNTTINDDSWHHYIVQSNGTAHSMWIDGVQQSLSYSVGSNNGDWLNNLTSIEQVMFGAWEKSGSYSAYYDGELDETFLTNTHLNSSQIASVYNSGTGVRKADLPASVSSTLLSYWPMNGDLAVNAVEAATEFNGTSQWVESTSTHFDPGTNDFSVEGWFWTDAASGTFRLAQKRGTGTFGTQPGWLICWDNVQKWGYTAVEATDGSYVKVGSGEDNTGGLQANRWNHVALTFDNSTGTMKVYFNGTDENWTQTTSGTIAGKSVAAAGRNFTIGCAWDSAGSRSQYLNGRVAHWNYYLGKVLTPAEVTALYNYRHGLAYSDTDHPAGATAGWTLDATATPYADVVASYDLTAQGTPTEAANSIPYGQGGPGDDTAGTCGAVAVNTTTANGIPAGDATPASSDTVNYFYSVRTGGWFREVFASNTYNPATCAIYDGDDPDDRTLIIGSNDGYIRHFDSTVATDDGTAFEATVTMGPIQTQGEHILSSVQAVTDANGATVKYEVLSGDTPELALTDASATFTGEDGQFTPGRSLVSYPRNRGYATYLKVGTNDATTRWGLENVEARIVDIPSHRGRHNRTK